MRIVTAIAAACLLLPGCYKGSEGTPKPAARVTTQQDQADQERYANESANESGAANDTAAPTGGEHSSDQPKKTAKKKTGPSRGGPASPSLNAVPIADGTATLSPENTSIVFVGTHQGDNPDPRTGGFEKFTGSIVVDPESRMVKSISVDIETDSLWTQIERLTNHLKSPDFFEVREFPTAKFTSSQIAPGEDAGKYFVEGTLTLHGVEKVITFPAQMNLSEDGLTLRSTFTLNRNEFGINYGPDRVHDEVAMTVLVGAKTDPSRATSGGSGGGGGFDPSAMFKRWDQNSDGKLSGEEIPDRMRNNLEAIDKDKDGAVTLEEFQARMSQLSGPGGGGRGPGGGGRGPGGGGRGPGGGGRGGSGGGR